MIFVISKCQIVNDLANNSAPADCGKWAQMSSANGIANELCGRKILCLRAPRRSHCLWASPKWVFTAVLDKFRSLKPTCFSCGDSSCKLIQRAFTWLLIIPFGSAILMVCIYKKIILKWGGHPASSFPSESLKLALLTKLYMATSNFASKLYMATSNFVSNTLHWNRWHHAELLGRMESMFLKVTSIV